VIGSDGMPSSAKMLAGDAQHDNPLRGGMLHMEELPLADSRTAAYKIIRNTGPVARDGHGAYLVTEAGAASDVLRHPELFSSKRAFDSLASPIPIAPAASGPPGHPRYRQVLRPFFGARGAARWLPMVRALAAELTGRFTGRGQCDLFAELALPLPAEVFRTLSGLPPADRGWLAARKEAVLGAVGIGGAEPPSGASAQLAAELCEYLISHIAERRRNGGADLPGRLPGRRCGWCPGSGAAGSPAISRHPKPATACRPVWPAPATFRSSFRLKAEEGQGRFKIMT
jgi:cytochrome P450